MPFRRLKFCCGLTTAIFTWAFSLEGSLFLTLVPSPLGLGHKGFSPNSFYKYMSTYWILVNDHGKMIMHRLRLISTFVNPNLFFCRPDPLTQGNVRGWDISLALLCYVMDSSFVEYEFVLLDVSTKTYWLLRHDLL